MPEPIPFLAPRFVGERFQGGVIPLEVLKDLAVLEEMIVEVAKWSYLRDNPDRRRSPRGFSDGISLRVTDIHDGSAIPMIALFVANLALFPQENQIYFERARDLVLSAIDAAEHNQSITEHLPASLLGYFQRVGRSLRDGESIEFNPENDRRPSRLDRLTRRKLVLASGNGQELTEEAVLRGAVPEADQERMTFTLQVISGPRVTTNLDAQHLETILEAFNGYRNGARVVLQGVARYDRYSRLKSIDTVEHISLLDPNDVAARLDELRALEAGWLNGKGVSLSPDGLNWLSHSFDAFYPDHLPPPYLYPTPEGGVRAEWSSGPYEMSLEISLEQDQPADWHALHLVTDEEEAPRQLNLNDRADWEWLVRRIQDITAQTNP